MGFKSSSQDPSTSNFVPNRAIVKKKSQSCSTLEGFGFTIHKSPKKEPLPQEWKNVIRKMRSPTFKDEFKKVSLRSFDKAAIELKENGQPVRNQEARRKFMHGYDCECCAPYYNALGLSEAEKQERIEQVSRHRGFEPTPRTPERYWDVEFPSRQTQNELGLSVITNSPLFKEKPQKNCGRKINWRAISTHSKRKLSKK